MSSTAITSDHWPKSKDIVISLIQGITKKREGSRHALETTLRSLSHFVELGKMAETFVRFTCEKEVVEIQPTNIARTEKIQLDGWQLLFEEYLLNHTFLYVFVEEKANDHRGRTYGIFWMNNYLIIRFGFRTIWRIMQISKGFGLGG